MFYSQLVHWKTYFNSLKPWCWYLPRDIGKMILMSLRCKKFNLLFGQRQHIFWEWLHTTTIQYYNEHTLQCKQGNMFWYQSLMGRNLGNWKFWYHTIKLYMEQWIWWILILMSHFVHSDITIEFPNVFNLGANTRLRFTLGLSFICLLYLYFFR